MKKIMLPIMLLVTCMLAFAGCGDKNAANKRLASQIERSSTDLIYSVESMDSLEMEDLTVSETNSQAGATNKNEIKSASAAINTAAVKTPTVANQTTNPSKRPNATPVNTRQTRMRGANPRKTFQSNSNESANTVSETANSTASEQIKTTNNASNRQVNAANDTDTKTRVKSNRKRNSRSRKGSYSLTSNELGTPNEYTDEHITKRAELMLLCSKLRNGDINLTDEKKQALSEALTLLDQTNSYLAQTKGKIGNEYSGAKSQKSKDLSLSKMIALREKMAIRQAKLQTSLLAMDQIIEILGGTVNAETETVSPEVPTETKTIEPKAIEPKTIEPKTIEPKAIEPKTVEPKAERTPRITQRKTSAVRNSRNENATNGNVQNNSRETYKSIEAKKVENKGGTISYVVTPVPTETVNETCPNCATKTITKTTRTTNETNPINPISRSGKSQMVSAGFAAKSFSSHLFMPRRIPQANTMPLVETDNYYEITHRA